MWSASNALKDELDCRAAGVDTESLEKTESPELIWDDNFAPEELGTPVICIFSKAWWPPPVDWPSKNVEVVGRCVFGEEAQGSKARNGCSFFTAGEHEEVVNFLHVGPPPVYIGWGSMTVKSKEFMTALAVGALKESGQRGIILGGWAELSLDCLEGERNTPLRQYCSSNVLFAKAVPHEWLLPQCVCAVHHGGVGTTQASLGAGVPTVVTPVFLDQFDNADHVGMMKRGVGTCHLAKLTVGELAAAIHKCCTDEAVRTNARQLAEEMSKEVGVLGAARVVDRFLEEEVLTGSWLTRHKKRREMMLERRARNRRLPEDQFWNGWWAALGARYPPLERHWQEEQQRSHWQSLAEEGRLWTVKASSCLVRGGESLKSPEVGRFAKSALLEALAANGSRLHVRKCTGTGPEQGWVSPIVSGKEVLERVHTLSQEHS